MTRRGAGLGGQRGFQVLGWETDKDTRNLVRRSIKTTKSGNSGCFKILLCLLVQCAARAERLTLLQRRSQQHGRLGQLLRVRLDEQSRLDRRRVRPPAQSGELRVDLQLLLQAGADLLVPAQQTL